jgi:tetratricopeptide (TPR) repeat protein
MNDRYGLAVTTSSPTALQRYAEGLELDQTQNYGGEEKFRQAIEADEGFALAHGALAFNLMSRVMVPEARESADQALSFSSGITKRERQQVEIVAHYVYGKNVEAYALLREHLAEFPTDGFLLRLAQRLFNLGCSGAGVPNYPPLFFDLMKSLEPFYGDDWAFMATSAWAHHEVGLMDDGMRLAQKSLDLRPDNAVAAHSVAHVFFERGQHDEGSDFLTGWLEGYDRRIQYGVHMSWHQALFDLANGRYGEVLSGYEKHIRPAVAAKSYAALADSASLVWRMHIYGNDTPPAPWEELLGLAAPAAQQAGVAFRDAHAALVFAVAGDDESLERVMAGLKDAAGAGSAVAGEATLPLVQGIQAFAHGEYADAVSYIEPVFPQLTRIGGSHAQREVFEDTLLEAYIRAEQFDKAEEMLTARLRQRETARDTFWLGRTLAPVGRTEEAKASLGTAKSYWRDADRTFAEAAALESLAGQTG